MAPQACSLRASDCQVGQRVLVPTHVFGDEAAACDRQVRPACCAQRCSLVSQGGHRRLRVPFRPV
eukprot:scaffold7040_cov66-Phaeocystis_antarctica.AAC.5